MKSLIGLLPKILERFALQSLPVRQELFLFAKREVFGGKFLSNNFCDGVL